jgi:protein TonB
MELIESPMRHDPDEALERVLKGYALTFLLVVLVHAAGWYWSHRELPETPAIVPEMVDVELIAPPSPVLAPPAPPAAAQPAPPKPLPQPVKPKPVPKTQPKKAEAAPKPTKPDTTETDDLGKRLRELNESMRAQPAPSQTQVRPAAKPKVGGSTDQKVSAAHDAAYLHNPKPNYPSIARARNWEGVVRLKVYVLPNGSAGQVQLAGSSGHDVLDDAALEVVRRWRFVPAKRGEEAVASWVHVPLVFKLSKGG